MDITNIIALHTKMIKDNLTGLDSFEGRVNGWLVMTPNHPNSGEASVFFNSFRTTKRESIAAFIDGSGSTWDHWRKKYGYRCVKAESTIRILASVENMKLMGYE